jgi:hypothetical protein
LILVSFSLDVQCFDELVAEKDFVCAVWRGRAECDVFAVEGFWQPVLCASERNKALLLHPPHAIIGA